MSKPYKYQEFLNEFGVKCPGELSILEIDAYRFVNEDVNNDNNWLPPAIVDDQRPNNRCSSYALSFFSDKQKAIDKHRALRERYPQIIDRVGGYLAYGFICKCDGKCTEINRSSKHFDLFDYRDARFNNRFTIIDKLI